MSHVCDPTDRVQHSQQIEDELVDGGMEAVEAYEEQCREKRSQAKCLAEHDGVTRAFIIAKKARERLENQ